MPCVTLSIPLQTVKEYVFEFQNIVSVKETKTFSEKLNACFILTFNGTYWRLSWAGNAAIRSLENLVFVPVYRLIHRNIG